MKITKAQLKQIIKEELNSALNERGAFSTRRAAEIGAQMSMDNQKAPVGNYAADSGTYGREFSKEAGEFINLPKSIELMSLARDLAPADPEVDKIVSTVMMMQDYTQASLHKELKELMSLGKEEQAIELLYKTVGTSRQFSSDMSSGKYGRLD